MNLEQRISAFVKLGKYISENKEIFVSNNSNTWFTPENVNFALDETSKMLNENNLREWVNMYPNIRRANAEPKKIGVVTAGNIPLVGFHDFLSVLISGNIFVGKLSSKDSFLMKIIISSLINIKSDFDSLINVREDKLADFDAVIATGSNNTARYFEYYFGKKPHIIRKNRNSVAVISGNETKEELELLFDDIFQYFGLGCRNVSKLFLPKGYDLDNIFKAAEKYKNVANHNKYSNNYGYNRSIYLMNTDVFWDNGFMLLKEDINYSSPVSVVYFENYTELETVKRRLKIDNEKIQCVVSAMREIENSIYFGKAQSPKLWDYADNVDTIKFLLELD